MLTSARIVFEIADLCDFVRRLFVHFTSASIPANTWHSPKAVSTLAHRLRRWPNIETALGECPVFAGMVIVIRIVNRYY